MRALADHLGWQAPPNRVGKNARFLALYKAPVPARPTPHPLDEGVDGVMRMVDACDQVRHQTLLILCGLAGLRVSEACEVRPDDLNFETRVITVRLGKGDKDRHIPMSTRAMPYLVAACNEPHQRPDAPLVGMSESGARKVVTRYGLRAGINRGVASHDLRSTFATAVYNGTNGDIAAVQDLLGHAQIETTRRYIGVAEGTLRKAVEL